MLIVCLVLPCDVPKVAADQLARSQLSEDSEDNSVPKPASTYDQHDGHKPFTLRNRILQLDQQLATLVANLRLELD